VLVEASSIVVAVVKSNSSDVNKADVTFH
jgi:hypothetical protein